MQNRGKRVRNSLGAWLLAGGCMLSPYTIAADFSEMTNEQLMGVQPQQMSAEEREQFRTEMNQRMQNMSAEEQNAFRNEFRSTRSGGRAFGGQGGGRGGH